MTPQTSEPPKRYPASNESAATDAQIVDLFHTTTLMSQPPLRCTCTMTCVSNEALNNGTRMRCIHHWKTLVSCVDCTDPYYAFCIIPLCFSSIRWLWTEPYGHYHTHQFGAVCGPNLCEPLSAAVSDHTLHQPKALLRNSNILPRRQQSRFILQTFLF